MGTVPGFSSEDGPGFQNGGKALWPAPSPIGRCGPQTRRYLTFLVALEVLTTVL